VRHSRKNGKEVREAIEGGYEQRLPSESEFLTQWKYNSVMGKIRWRGENKERSAADGKAEREGTVNFPVYGKTSKNDNTPHSHIRECGVNF
jgi:hypothetical protein